MTTKPKAFSLEDLTPKHRTPAPKAQAKPKKHWTDDFFKHLDALGDELRKAHRKAKA